jgi:DnaJ-class molecular chaperone
MRSRMRTCERCEGSGVVILFTFMGFTFALPCAACGGSGKRIERRAGTRAPAIHPQRRKKKR